jgi:predicted acyltransferase
VGYWYLMLHVAVPGFGMPTHAIDPGGNIGAWFDRQLMSTVHFYQHKQFDPEGLMSTIPAVATTLLGVLTGVWLQTKNSASRKAAGMLGAGAALIGGGLLWSLDFPLNKRVWTSSYVLFVGGIALVAFAVLYFLIDRKPRPTGGEPQPARSWMYPWLVFGSNALTAYCVAELLAITVGAVKVHGGSLHRFLFGLIPASLGPVEVRSLIFAILFVSVCFLPMLVLYRKKIFLRL